MRAPDVVTRSRLDLVPYMLVGPAVVLLVVMILFPLLLVAGTSLTDWQIGAGWPNFAGLDTYRELLADPDFREAVANTVQYGLMVVPTTTALGLLAALLISSCGRGAAVYRLILFVPSVATLAAMAVAWQMLFSPAVGGIPQLVRALGYVPGNWLQDRTTALPILALIGVWSEAGFAMLFFLAGLKSVPRELHEAMALDNGGMAERLFHVVLPHLAPISVFVLAFTALRALRVFDTVAIITRGGPEKSTLVILYYIYQQGFQLFRTNLAAGASVLFVVAVILLSAVQLLGRTAGGKR
ncbi:MULTISPECIES: sugar ABC transporter permease [unclassified Bradyrhizobium]|uniref:carbohydrate ABC transporter permease n=1 Tax=unclassified Bradyrhizobium TaxID=2631580 RepID=UPI002916F2D3|nr:MULTISPECIES: sugar ABC transporter permease [unclassified Bradyrhizobium]